MTAPKPKTKPVATPTLTQVMSESISIQEARRVVERAMKEASASAALSPVPWYTDPAERAFVRKAERVFLDDCALNEDAALICTMRSAWEPLLAMLMRKIEDHEGDSCQPFRRHVHAIHPILTALRDHYAALDRESAPGTTGEGK